MHNCSKASMPPVACCRRSAASMQASGPEEAAAEEQRRKMQAAFGGNKGEVIETDGGRHYLRTGKDLKDLQEIVFDVRAPAHVHVPCCFLQQKFLLSMYSGTWRVPHAQAHQSSAQQVCHLDRCQPGGDLLDLK
jgi:hypothetical protein